MGEFQSSRRNLTVPIYKKEDKTVVLIREYHCYQLHKNCNQLLLSRLIINPRKVIG
jgi:hypothetical protein